MKKNNIELFTDVKKYDITYDTFFKNNIKQIRSYIFDLSNVSQSNRNDEVLYITNYIFNGNNLNNDGIRCFLDTLRINFTTNEGNSTIEIDCPSYSQLYLSFNDNIANKQDYIDRLLQLKSSSSGNIFNKLIHNIKVMWEMKGILIRQPIVIVILIILILIILIILYFTIFKKMFKHNPNYNKKFFNLNLF